MTSRPWSPCCWGPLRHRAAHREVERQIGGCARTVVSYDVDEIGVVGINWPVGAGGRGAGGQNVATRVTDADRRHTVGDILRESDDVGPAPTRRNAHRAAAIDDRAALECRNE